MVSIPQPLKVTSLELTQLLVKAKVLEVVLEA
jgi:hypothetical protein